MSDLSPEQLKFLQKHLGFDDAGWRKKRKLKEQIQEFWRRRDKAEAEIKDLPPDHPSKASLEQAIKDATKKAEGGDIKGAYKDLEGTKTQSRQAAKVVRDGVDLNTVQGNVAELRKSVHDMLSQDYSVRHFADDRSQALLDKATNLPTITGNTHEEVMAGVSANYRAEQEILAEWEGVASQAERNLKIFAGMMATKPTIASQIDLTAHNISLLNKKDPNASKLPHNSDFTAAEDLARQNHLEGDGSKTRTDVAALMKQRREALLTTLRAKKAHPPLESLGMTDDKGNPITGDAATKEKENLAERFKHLEAEEKKRFEAAKKAFVEAVKNDTAFLSMTDDTSPITHRDLRKIDVADELNQAGIDVTDTRKTPDAIAQAASKLVADKFDEAMQNAGPRIPDEVFDMCTRSNRDWYIEAASAAGITFDPDKPETIDPTVWAKIKAAGDKMAETVRGKYPNTSKFDKKGPTEITIGGTKYAEFKRLGSGGGGEVWLGKDSNGNEIVLKTPLGFKSGAEPSQTEYADFAGEAVNHRAASGGEFDPCPENVLDMKGMVLAPNGLPLIAMDLAASGDADRFSNATKGAEATGLMSPQAMQAMNAVAIQDMLKGLKAMQASGMTHHDLKPLNVFVDKDGTFKLADFGLARFADGHDTSVGNVSEFTPGFEPPELSGEGDMTQKSDNFTMGVILGKMTDPYGGWAQYSDKFSSSNPTAGQKKDGKGAPIKASALDRLVNALLDPDPAKRPTVDAALMSSFLTDPDTSYTKQDIERLRKAAARYAATVGKETEELVMELNFTEGEIVQLELSKSDALTQAKIAHYQRTLAQRQSQLRQVQTKLAASWDEKEKTRLKDKEKSVNDSIAKFQKKIDDLKRELGKANSEVDLEEIDKRIEANRTKAAGYRKQIEEIHKKDDYKAIIAELDASNKAFM